MTVIFIILVEKNRGKFSLKEHCAKSFSLRCVPLVSFLYSGFNLQSCLFGIFHNNNLFWIATQVYTIHCYLQNNLLLGSGVFFFFCELLLLHLGLIYRHRKTAKIDFVLPYCFQRYTKFKVVYWRAEPDYADRKFYFFRQEQTSKHWIYFKLKRKFCRNGI